MIGEIIFGAIMMLVCLALYWHLYFRVRHLEVDLDYLAGYDDDDDIDGADAQPEKQQVYTARSVTLSEEEALSLLKENLGLYNEWKDHKDLCPICMMTHAEAFTTYFLRFSKGKDKYGVDVINTTWEQHETASSECSLCGHELAESKQRR